MNVEIEYVAGVKSELFRLLSQRSRSFEDALRYLGIYLDDIEEQFVAHGGEIPGVLEVQLPDGRRLWWHYVDGVWIGYTLQDRRSWLFGATMRRVLVFGFRNAPPTVV